MAIVWEVIFMVWFEKEKKKKKKKKGEKNINENNKYQHNTKTLWI